VCGVSSSNGRLPLRLAFWLAVTIALDTGVQLVWKLAAASLPVTLAPAEMAGAVLSQPLFIAVGLLFAGQALTWLKALDGADLSYVQSMTAISYVSVCGLSALLLGEEITSLQALGVALVLAGVWLIGRSGHTSLDAGPLQP
jgi:drug/metabolite transporter (DMT)-like permease